MRAEGGSLRGAAQRSAEWTECKKSVEILSRLRFIEAFGRDARYALRGDETQSGIHCRCGCSRWLSALEPTSPSSACWTRSCCAVFPCSVRRNSSNCCKSTRISPARNGFWSRQSFEHFRDNNHVFSALTCTGIDTQTKVSVDGSEPETLIGESVPGNYFPVLGLKPALGRLIGPDDNPTSAAVAVDELVLLEEQVPSGSSGPW